MAEKIRIIMEDGYYAPSTVLWLLAEELTVRQAAILLLNEDPEQFPWAEYPEQKNHSPIGYSAARQVIVSALLSEKVDGRREWKTETRYNPDGYEAYQGELEGVICADRSTINMDSLRAWLDSKNVTVEQFVGLAGTSEDFLDREDPAYSPKLAATVAAWRHVKKTKVNGMSVKQQLMDWLRDNSARYWPDGLDAKVTDTFLKEAARIANWDADGGRPSLNEQKNTDESPPAKRDFEITNSKDFSKDYSSEFDDEIPF